MLRGPKQEADKSKFYNKKLQPKKEFSGVSPNILIGSWGYPFVNVGALSTEDKTDIDNPKTYAEGTTDINNIISQRQSLINSKVILPVQRISERFVEQTQEIAKTQKVLDTEVHLRKAITPRTEFHQMSMPHGPSAELKKLDITSSATIRKPIERLTSDTDVLAKDAILELSKKETDEYQLTKLLSTGTLGQERKLVPTKWSITAVDDMLGKNLYEKILDYQEMDYQVLHKELLGNIFTILFLPGAWSFELFEMTMPNTIHNNTNEIILSHDYEYAQGRKKYVEETAGAYYAAKLAVIEYLITKQRQARAIVLRTITNRYTAPLGVWVIREGVRNALTTKPLDTPNSKRELLEKAKELLRNEGVKDVDNILTHSQILKEKQTRIKEFKGGLSGWM